MKKAIVTIVAILAISVVTGTVRAEWGSAGVVTQIQYNRTSYQEGDIWVFLEGTGCSATNEFFKISRTTSMEDIEEMMRLIVASKLSERPVRFGFTRVGGSCFVYSVRF